MTRRTRRLWTSGLALSTLCGVGLLTLEWMSVARCERHAEHGLRALEEGRFALASRELARRLEPSTCEDADAEILLGFARARARSPSPGSAHVVESIAALKKLTVLDPDHVEAWHDLALAWLGLGQPARAVEAARHATRLAPGERAIERVLVGALLAAGAVDEVRTRADRGLASEPDRWWLRLARLSAIAMGAREGEGEVPGTGALAPDAKGLVEAYRSVLRGDRATARALLLEMPLADASETELLAIAVEFMQGLGLSEHALERLHGLRDRLPRSLRSVYLSLAWQRGRARWIVEHLERSPAAMESEPSLVLLDTLARERAGLPEASRPATDPVESEARRRWEALVDTVAPPTDPVRRVEAAEGVLELDPRNVWVLQLLAEGWLALQEPLRAARFAERAMQAAPGWGAPAITRTRALLAAGANPDATLAASREALRRMPRDPGAGALLARTWARALKNPGAPPRPFTDLLAALREGLPETREGLYPGTGADGARGTAAAGGTPGVSTAGAAACREIEDAVASSRCWLALVDEHPRDLKTHLLALLAAVAGDDRSTQARLVERLVERTPESAALWRLARARLLLADGSSERDAARAALLLRHVLEHTPGRHDAHALMAIALARLGDVPGLGSHLRSAASISPAQTPRLLRLSLGLLATTERLTPRTLLGWWESLTWLELGRRDIHSPSGPGVSGGAEGGRTALLARLRWLAAHAEARQRADLAEVVYRRILELDPGAHVGMNNLAMILSDRPRQLTEALRLAREATRLAPRSRDYADTLSIVQRAWMLHRGSTPRRSPGSVQASPQPLI